jgi:predicted branched-subunit amino acid permease
MSAPGQAEQMTPAPRWVAPLFAIVGAGLVPWTVWIAYDLPGRHIARHWDVAWAGFDVMMALLLLATAYAAFRRVTWIQSTASAAATMLVCDAWFDIVTSQSGAEMWEAIAEAALAELPLAALCGYIVYDAESFLAATVNRFRR